MLKFLPDTYESDISDESEREVSRKGAKSTEDYRIRVFKGIAEVANVAILGDGDIEKKEACGASLLWG